MRIKIIGNGAWGNALYSVLRKNTPSVSIAAFGEEITDADVVILSIPTQAIRDVLKTISFSKKRGAIINTAKGIEKETHLLPYQIIHSVFQTTIDYYTLIGPSFAQEVVECMPTLVNLGYREGNKDVEKIKSLFQTDFFRVRLTTGVEALELSAAFKNIYAIVCGLAEGMGYKTNTRVKLLVLAMEEMDSLYKSLGLKFDGNMTAGTIGDLILTCNSMESRNFSFGALLAHYPVSQAHQKISSTVEGYHSLASIEHFKKHGKSKLPLATFVKSLIETDDPKKAKQSFERFVSSI